MQLFTTERRNYNNSMKKRRRAFLFTWRCHGESRTLSSIGDSYIHSFYIFIESTLKTSSETENAEFLNSLSL